MAENLESSRPFTSQEIVSDLQTEIKLLIKNTIFRASEYAKFQNKVNEIIESGIKDIKNDGLANTIRETLKKFANTEFEKMVKYLDFGSLPIIVALTGAIIDTREMQKIINEKVDKTPIRRIESGFSNLASSTPKVDNRQPLYGYAEMQERYERNQNMVSDLKEKTNLVICDTHSNCSDRCFPWQGRVYSLDHTTGTTSDGRKYVPLEEATQARDKYGNINGLLGYNCRHKLIKYTDGKKSPTVTKKEQQKQYEINNEQRLYERTIRDYKERALLSITEQEKTDYKAKVRDLTAKYKAFCQENGVVEYRTRLKI